MTAGHDPLSAVMKAAEARLLSEARERIERETAADMAELHRLAAKYNLRVVSAESVETVMTVTAATAVASPEAEPPHANGATFLPKSSISTLGQLIAQYRTHPKSPYRELRFGSRTNADGLIDRIVEKHADLILSELNADGIRKVYELWAADGKVSIGHSFATKMRALFSFGTTVLDDPGCQRLSIIMNRMRFQNPPTRDQRLTTDQVIAIRGRAHLKGKPSIALAQAIQFEFGLSQKDTIGEYVPATEPGPTSDIVLDGMKWLYGIRWEQLDKELVLRHVTSFGGVLLELDLKKAPMVLEELEKQYKGVIPKSGAIIISEWNQKPWSGNEFRRWWRKLADGVGVPKTVRNMDSGRAADRKQYAVKASSLGGLDLEDEEVRLH